MTTFNSCIYYSIINKLGDAMKYIRHIYLYTFPLNSQELFLIHLKQNVENGTANYPATEDI